MNDDFALTLTLAELLALLDLLGFTSMNGLPPEPLAGGKGDINDENR